MSGNSGKIPDREDPFLAPPSDFRAAMKNTSNGPRFLPADLQNDPKAAHDALLHWDMQDEQTLRLLARHPVHGGRLSTLQRADGWLRQSAADSIVARTQNGDNGPGPDLLTPSILDCPSAEELFDFAAAHGFPAAQYGRSAAPSAATLPVDRQLAIDRHLAACASCDGFVATLAAAPPAVLFLGEDEPAVAAPGFRPASAPAAVAVPIRRFPVRRVLVPLAAAAAIVIGIGLWRAFTPTSTRASWPTAPLLRGDTADALIWPRGRVLERSAAIERFVPALAAATVFELGSVSGPVRIQLTTTAGGAFDEPAPIATWNADAATSTAPVKLAAGHYTWKAWSQERGLEIELGSRDFEVVADEALLREVAELLADSDEDAVVRAIALLDARGFRADARALARTLPPSPERDAYLGRSPGR